MSMLLQMNDSRRACTVMRTYITMLYPHMYTVGNPYQAYRWRTFKLPATSLNSPSCITRSKLIFEGINKLLQFPLPYPPHPLGHHYYPLILLPLLFFPSFPLVLPLPSSSSSSPPPPPPPLLLLLLTLVTCTCYY